MIACGVHVFRSIFLVSQEHMVGRAHDLVPVRNPYVHKHKVN